MPAVPPLSPDLFARAVDTLTLAFQDDAVKLALVADPRRRRAFNRWVFKGVARYCVQWGEVHTAENANAVACWLPPGGTTPQEWRMLRAWDFLPGPYWLAGWRATQDFFAIQDACDEQHKRLVRGAHWYLWALAVRPECQGQGLGGGLLERHLARSDVDGLPCYLETQTPRNVAFYEKRGFCVAHAAEIKGLSMWFMLRDPGPRPAGG